MPSVPSTAVQLSGYSSAQLALIKRTVAKDTSPDEFDLFVEVCRRYELDPFRRQVSAVIFSKDNPDKRQMAIIVSRDGHRIIAQRCGDYRPASEPAEIEFDADVLGPLNPMGLVKATVRLWKADRHGVWYPVVGEARWNEFVPIRDKWAWDEAQRKRVPTGEKEIDPGGMWPRMPILMLTKCAEMQALRAGWPDTFGGIFAEEEMDRARVDAVASEVLEAEAERQRVARVGGRGILISFDPQTNVLENVPVGAVADRCLAFIREHDAEAVKLWAEQNRAALQQFWTASPNDALAVKQAQEKKLAGAGKATNKEKGS